jgi:hypothetical protein
MLVINNVASTLYLMKHTVRYQEFDSMAQLYLLDMVASF